VASSEEKKEEFSKRFEKFADFLGNLEENNDNN
jgi:hypothetical protein